MGYCPQHDAQWKNITVREHLECYAAIRGVPTQEISRYLKKFFIEDDDSANKNIFSLF